MQRKVTGMRNIINDLLEKPYDFNLQGNGETELVSKLSFLRSICKYQKKSIAIWGYRRWGIYMLDFCKKEDVKVGLIVDKNTEGINLKEVCSPEQLKGVNDVASKFLFIVTVQDEDEKKSIEDKLMCLGCDYIFLDSCLQDLTVKIDWYIYFKNNCERIANVYNLLADELSKDVYYEYVKAIITNTAYNGEVHKSRVKYFESYKKLNEEVFLNIGGFVGDTVFNFLEQYVAFKKIYAVEGERKNFECLEKNISILPQSLRDKIELVNKYLDDSNSTNFMDVTLVNMDIEGMEKDVLRGLEKLIINQRPVLAICAYHLESDIVELPEMVLQMVKDYCILFRKYPCCTYYNDISKKGELVMYAVPKERML